MEPHAPHVGCRFTAMEHSAAAGIPPGTAFMPILPGLFDDPANLEAAVKRTADSDGQFVLAGALTPADQQRAHFFQRLARLVPTLLPPYEALYPDRGERPRHGYWHSIALRVAELCDTYGISDHMARPITSHDPPGPHQAHCPAIGR